MYNNIFFRASLSPDTYIHNTHTHQWKLYAVALIKYNNVIEIFTHVQV